MLYPTNVTPGFINPKGLFNWEGTMTQQPWLKHYLGEPPQLINLGVDINPGLTLFGASSKVGISLAHPPYHPRLTDKESLDPASRVESMSLAPLRSERKDAKIDEKMAYTMAHTPSYIRKRICIYNNYNSIYIYIYIHTIIYIYIQTYVYIYIYICIYIYVCIHIYTCICLG